MLVLDKESDEVERKMSGAFPLTSFADAMFQLLIFFMLSAGLSPYSMLLLQSGPPEETVATNVAAPSSVETIEGGRAETWVVDAGRLLIDTQQFSLTELDNLIASVSRSDIQRIVVTTTPDARVQDLTLVLEAMSFLEGKTVQVYGLSNGG